MTSIAPQQRERDPQAILQAIQRLKAEGQHSSVLDGLERDIMEELGVPREPGFVSKALSTLTSIPPVLLPGAFQGMALLGKIADPDKLKADAGQALRISMIVAGGAEELSRQVLGLLSAIAGGIEGPRRGEGVIEGSLETRAKVLEGLPRIVSDEALQAVTEVFKLNEAQELFSDIVGEIVTLSAAAGFAGASVARGIGMLSMSSRGLRLEKISTMIAAAIGGGLAEPLRRTPLPEDFSFLDPAGSITVMLKNQGVADGPAKAIGGLVVGGAIGKLIDSVMAYRASKLARTMEAPAAKLEASRNQRIFFEASRPGAPAERVNMGEYLAKELAEREGLIPRIIIPGDETAAAVGQQMSREATLMSRPKLPREVTDGAVVEAAIRNNPQGTTLIQGVSLDEAAIAVKNIEGATGARVATQPIKRADGTFDLLMAADETPTLTISKITQTDEGGVVGRQFVGSLRVGTRKLSVVGFYETGSESVEVSLGNVGEAIDAAITTAKTGQVQLADDAGILGFGGVQDFAAQIFKAFPKVKTIRGVRVGGAKAAAGARADIAGQPTTLNVEFVIPKSARTMARLKKPPRSAELQQRAFQYRKEGAWEGQAALLADGSPVEYVGLTAAGRVKVRSPSVATAILEVDAKQVKTLPYHFEDTFTLGDDLVMKSLNEAEKTQYVAMRRRMIRALDEPEGELLQFERIASTQAGVFVRSAAAGEVQVYDSIAGDVLRFKDADTALTWVKNYHPIGPELSPEELTKLGPGFSMSLFGGGGVPPKAGEVLKVPGYMGTFKGAGAFEQFRKPLQAMLTDLERRTGVKLWSRGFRPVSQAVRDARNFETAWITGKRLERTGVTGLQEIQKAAGRGANAERVTDWLEAALDPARLKVVEQGMTPNEIKAARSLKQWYNRLFDEFGLDSDKFLTDYAPHIRKHADEFGNKVMTTWKQTRGEMSLPKELRFFADEFRFGTLRVYEKDAFEVAARYLRAGTNRLIVNEPWKQAFNVLRTIKDQSVTRPLFHYLEAIRGREFMEQKNALDITIRRMLKALPGGDRLNIREMNSISEDLALNMLGLSYQATMGFRLGLAIRNLTQTMQTTWTMLGTDPASFFAGLSKAMTRQGVDEAVKGGAITLRSVPVFGGEEFLSQMPGFLRKMSETSLKLYTGADTFNRAVAFHVGKLTAEKAIRNFARASTSARTGAQVVASRKALLTESRMLVYDLPIQDEFLRILQTDASKASQFAGVHAANVTQFLYGRGNQPRWLRSIYGKFVGQFATWPLWYIDFTTRTFRNISRNAGRGEALRFLGRLGIANAAIVVAGKEVLNTDLTRWASYNSFFYTGGPGAGALQAALGITSGMSSVLTLNEDKFAQRRVAEGVAQLRRIGFAFIPNFYAVRDIARITEMIQDGEPADITAALLGSRPTKEFLESRMADAVTIFMQGDEENPDTPATNAMQYRELRERVDKLIGERRP